MSRFLAIGASAALMASVSLVAATSASATAKPSASDCWCASSRFDRPVDVYTTARVEDQGVAVYVGGDLTVTTAKEIEGRVVIAGNADFRGPDSLNIGTAGGGGSAIAPRGGTDQLVVGGNLITGANLQVGFHAVHGGGNVVVGGAITGTVSTQSYQRGRTGTVSQNVGDAALKDYANLGQLVAQVAATGAGAAPVDVANGALTIAPGTYEISAADAAQLASLDITSRGTVTIVVSGDAVAIDGLKHVEVGGERVYQAHQYHSRDILWVFPDATSVHLGTNDQFPGTIVVPRADSTLTVATSTNGRILAAGNVAYTGGAGIEHHNYPWSGECTDLPPVPPTPTPTPTQEVSPTPTPTPTPPQAPIPAPVDVEEPSPSPSESPSPSPAAVPSPSPSPAVVVPGASDNGGSGDAAASGQDGLAHTGAAVTGAILAAIVLLVGGAVLLRLRRRSGRHTVEA